MPTTPDPRFSRRHLLQLGGVAAVGTGLAACAGPGSTAAPEDAAAPIASASAGGDAAVAGDINFYHWRAEDQEVLDEIIAAFEVENPAISVTQTIDPSDTYQSTAAQRARTGEIGDVLTSFRGAQFEQFIENDIYRDISDQPYIDLFVPALVEAGAVDGVQYAVPYQLVFNMPLINVDAMDAAGITEIPKDWPAYIAMLDALQAAGYIPIAYPGADIGNAGQYISTMVMNNAPSDDVFERVEAGELKATDEWWVKTLTQFQELSTYFQPNSLGTQIDPAIALFAQGQAAMLASGSYHVAAARAAGAEFPMDLAPPITSEPGELKYEGVYNATFMLGVNTATEEPEAANEFIGWLAQPVNAAVYANGTAQHVTVADVEYENPDLAGLQKWVTANTILAPRFQFDNLDIRNAMENSMIAVVGGASPEEAAAQAQTIIDEQLSA